VIRGVSEGFSVDTVGIARPGCLRIAGSSIVTVCEMSKSAVLHTSLDPERNRMLLPGTEFDPATHFRPGDLVYGLNKERFMMVDRIYSHMNNRGQYTSADHLNNQFLGTGVSGAGKNYGQGTQGSPQHGQDAAQYKTWLEARKTHRGAKDVLTDQMKTADESHLDDLYDAPERFKRISRSCKAGIAYTTLEKRNRVHFIINEVDMHATVTKPEKASKWITAKELRSVFRRWNVLTIRENVWFWENELTKLAVPVSDGKGGTTSFSRKVKAVKAPWESNPFLWSIYQPKDQNSYRITTGRSGHSVSYTVPADRDLAML
jgi:hypothetical protein